MNPLNGQLFHNVALAEYTSWRVGGPAKTLYLPSDLNDLVVFLKQLPVHEPLLWLGLGSNTLIRDSGFNGTVIVTQGCLKEIHDLGENRVSAQAGVACASLARHSARENLTGIEFLAGIPGTVGGALKMNAGCFNGETWQWVESVDVIDRSGAITTRYPNEFHIEYRHVESDRNEWFIAATFHLKTGDKAQSLETIRTLLDRRSQTQPTGEASCGSVFRNPPNDYAARLIESCGLKGYQHGGARVSQKHANFIINDGVATAREIEETIDYVAQTVQQKTSVQLRREVHIVGEK